jgi:hypothetical protein
MVLADAKGIDANLVGQRSFLDHIADDLRVRQGVFVGAEGDIAEGIQPEFELLWHTVFVL